MLRIALHWHACFASWIACDRGWVQFAWLCALHSISTCTLDSLGHHAWKCVIGGPRIEAHPPLSHKYDKECGWCIHCLKCIAMPSSVLCCCQNRFCRKIWPAGSVECRSAKNVWPRVQFMVDDHFKMAGDDPTQPVVFYNTQRSNLGSCAIFREAEQSKQRQTCAWRWISEQTRARAHWILFPRPLLLS